MANTLLSGYLAASQSIIWTSGQGLDSLTDNEWTDLSDQIDNRVTKYPFADFELNLGNAAYSGFDSSVALYIIPSIDDVNFGQWVGNVATQQQVNRPYLRGRFQTTGGAGAQGPLILNNVLLPNGLFRIGFRNFANATTPASGNTAFWRPHSMAN